MSNAVIFFHSDAYDSQVPRLMGRQAAGESFLRGFIRHADVERFYFWNWGAEPLEKRQAIVGRIAQTDKPVVWLERHEYARFSEAGTLFVSSPANAPESWTRQLVGPSLYSLCGLTHTIASQGAMDAVGGLLTAPVEPWDATICTSRAVTRTIQGQLDEMYAHLAERFGAVRRPFVRLETIPLGVNVDDFTRSDADRARLRGDLGIADDDLVVLFVGRFSTHAKMHAGPMAKALEAAARRTRRRIHWLQVGWANNPHLHEAFTTHAHSLAPSVTCHVLDGRRADVRFACWSAGDVFFSLSDNIQETFGLTPVEALAAGLPQVISDWDGYRDTVRHGVDGFRVPTRMARPGLGGDLAVGFANGWQDYDHYIGDVALFTEVDVAAAADALAALFENDDLRRRMGEAGQARARAEFDWRAIVPRYQALWAELAAIRKASPPKARGRINPWRPDPFTHFADYPTEALRPEAVLTLVEGVDAPTVGRMLRHPALAYQSISLPSAPEFGQVVATLQAKGPAAVAQVLELFAPGRRGAIERGLLTLAKFDLIRISPTPPVRES